METSKEILPHGSKARDVNSDNIFPRHHGKCHVLRSCQKHGNHSDFIPIQQLSNKFGDSSMLSAEFLETVRQLGRWVVRVRVQPLTHNNTTSICSPVLRARPRHFEPARTCTGLVTSVGSDIVRVQVPLHAVQDNVEAKHTTVEFFYDSDDGSDVVSVRGTSLTPHHFSHTAHLTCHSSHELRRRFKSLEKPRELSVRDCVDLGHMTAMTSSAAVLISHPHGFSKQVSVGQFWGGVGDGDMDASEKGAFDPRTIFGGTIVNEPTSISLSGVCGAGKSSSSLSSSSILSASASSLSSSTLSLASSATALSSSPLPSSSTSPSLSSSSSFITPSLSSPCLSRKHKSTSISGDVIQTHPPFLQTSPQTAHHSPLGSNNVHHQTSKLKATLSHPETVKSVTSREFSDKAGNTCKTLYSLVLGSLQQLLWWPLADSHDAVRVYHDAASCPGSSGGALLLIGPNPGAEVRDSLTSYPFFSHVGTAGDLNLGVAVGVFGVGGDVGFHRW